MMLLTTNAIYDNQYDMPPSCMAIGTTQSVHKRAYTIQTTHKTTDTIQEAHYDS